jgi:hypothetical protein
LGNGLGIYTDPDKFRAVDVTGVNLEGLNQGAFDSPSSLVAASVFAVALTRVFFAIDIFRGTSYAELLLFSMEQSSMSMKVVLRWA